MGCYFLTLSLMSSKGVPVDLMGVILPIYALIDMIETGVNVWSDSAVAAMTDHDLRGKLPEETAIPVWLTTIQEISRWVWILDFND